MNETLNKQYFFTQNWFNKNIKNWIYYLSDFKDKPFQALEIGVYEGVSTIWLLENILLNENSMITCIDTFQGGIEHQTDENVKKNDLLFLEERFKKNIKMSGKSHKVNMIKSSSFYGLLTLLSNKKQNCFDFIYIDGSHVAKDVISDALLSWELLKKKGILIFDDYKWDKYPESYNNPRIAVDFFIQCFEPEIEILDKNYQVIIRKL